MQRINPAYLKNGWSSFGHHVLCWLCSLISLGGEAVSSAQFSARERFLAAGTAYFALLMGAMEAQLRCGKDWSQQYLPSTTVRNAAHVCACNVLSCMYAGKQGRDSFSPHCFAEKISEFAFSTSKRPYRGTPTVAQGIHGSYRHHLEQSRKTFLPPTPMHDVVDAADAANLWQQCRREAALTMSFISSGKKADAYEKDFHAWFQDAGRGILMGAEADAVDPDLVDEALDDEEPSPEELLVQSLEDHAVNKMETIQLQAEIDKEGAAAVQDCPPAVQDPDPSGSAVPPIQDIQASANPSDALSEQRPDRTWSGLLQLICRLSEFNMEGPEAESLGALMVRQALLAPRMRAIAAAARIGEKVLSKTMVLNTSHEQQNDWNRLESELCLARAASLTDGSRNSRVAGWYKVQEKLQKAFPDAAADGSSSIIVKPSHLRPYFQEESPQVVVYNCSGDTELHVGIVTTVFRGAAAKSSGTSRKLRVTKPSIHALTMMSCSKVRVYRLAPASERKYRRLFSFSHGPHRPVRLHPGRGETLRPAGPGIPAVQHDRGVPLQGARRLHPEAAGGSGVLGASGGGGCSCARWGRRDVWQGCDAALHASLFRPRNSRFADFDCILKEAAVDVC